MNNLKFERIDADTIIVNGETYVTVKKLSEQFKIREGTIRMWMMREKPRTIRAPRLYVNFRQFVEEYMGIKI